MVLKNWITNGSTASVYLVIAQTDIEKGHKGINAFIVEKSFDGVTIGPRENKLGIRSSDTTSIMFSDVVVPKENRIGDDGFGFKFAMKTLEGGRILELLLKHLELLLEHMNLALNMQKKGKAFGKKLLSTKQLLLNWQTWQPKLTVEDYYVLKLDGKKTMILTILKRGQWLSYTALKKL